VILVCRPPRGTAVSARAACGIRTRAARIRVLRADPGRAVQLVDASVRRVPRWWTDATRWGLMGRTKPTPTRLSPVSLDTRRRRSDPRRLLAAGADRQPRSRVARRPLPHRAAHLGSGATSVR